MSNGCLNLNVEFEWNLFGDNEYINILVDIVALWEYMKNFEQGDINFFLYVWENIVLKF